MQLNIYANEKSWVFFQRCNEYSGKFCSHLKEQKQVGQNYSFTLSFILKEFQLV